jgi:hypothetical protein
LATCKAKTRQGTRCRRQAVEGGAYCHQHRSREKTGGTATATSGAPTAKKKSSGLIQVAATTAAAAAAIYVGAKEAKRFASRFKKNKKGKGKRKRSRR